tara:strand:- start:452 stop:1027 length:576 start_codon:yes stop_codon:yes gene_type:complete
MAPDHHLSAAVATVENFVPTDDAQRRARQSVLDFAATYQDALHRSCLAGHFTGSSWVVNHSGSLGLVLLHTKVDRWLQPGGHADGNGCLGSVALREATEETGIADLEIWSDPIDIDVHLFENRAESEPSHLHLDIRYLVRAPRDAVVRGNEESQALRWITEADLVDAKLSLDESTQRLARCGFMLAERVLT